MLKIGIIGTGLIAKEHAQAISMVSGSALLVAAADVDPERLQDFCASFHVPRRYQDAADLIADPDVALVAITTPPSVHEAMAVAALDAGKYVFCEKPLANSLASAVRIAEAEARHPGRLAVSHQLRYDASFRRLIWLCRNNWIGEIQSALIERHSYVPHAMNQGKKSWWGSWKVAGGGVLITQLIHELDLLLLVMGRPLSISAAMDTCYTGIESEDYVEATIRFAGEANARCVASVNSGRLAGGFTIQGSSGTVGLPWNFTTKDPSRMSKAIEELDKALPDTRPQSSSVVIRGSRFLARRLGVKGKPDLTPHARLYQEIAHSIKSRTPLPIPTADALGSLELCFAAYESAITDREIRIPLGSTSTVYSGVLKEDYDARKCSRKTTERKAIRTLSSNVNGNVRVGLIGLDTSHALTFTRILHDPNDPFHIPGARVVAAYPGGSPDMPISISRVDGFTSELRATHGVRIIDAPEDVAEACDLVFILASDGRIHPALFRTVAGCGKPVFIDKPFAVSASDAQDMFTLAAETGTRVFASSAFRYADGLVSALNSIHAAGERVKTCRVRYWLQIQETQGRYFWYGIHGAEMLLAIMGRGVREVEASGSADQDSITVWHDDGRQSAIIGSTVDGTFHVAIETEKRELNIDLSSSMPSLSARLLWSALDVLTEGHFPRLWGATAVGSVSGTRPGRAYDPVLEDTIKIVGLLDAAQCSYASQQRIALERIACSR
jgi:predicted dehydrogenase